MPVHVHDKNVKTKFNNKRTEIRRERRKRVHVHVHVYLLLFITKLTKLINMQIKSCLL